jgi:hypothetical protein
MTIIDGDVVDPTNRNRQLPALATNHGESKAEIMAERIKAINPEIELIVIKDFVLPEKVLEHLSIQPDYIIDANVSNADGTFPALYAKVSTAHAILDGFVELDSLLQKKKNNHVQAEGERKLFSREKPLGQLRPRQRGEG